MFHTSFFYCETFLVKKKLIPLFKVKSILKKKVDTRQNARYQPFLLLSIPKILIFSQILIPCWKKHRDRCRHR